MRLGCTSTPALPALQQQASVTVDGSLAPTVVRCWLRATSGQRGNTLCIAPASSSTAGGNGIKGYRGIRGALHDCQSHLSLDRLGAQAPTCARKIFNQSSSRGSDTEVPRSK